MAEAETTTDCAALKAEIVRLQAEFEGLWIKVSQGGPGGARYRELRRILDALRAKYATECGANIEDSSLPRSITADWKAG
jgi:hypothetical protein